MSPTVKKGFGECKQTRPAGQVNLWVREPTEKRLAAKKTVDRDDV